MKKIMTPLLIIGVIILVILILCVASVLIEVETKVDGRFVYVNSESYFDIYYDKETKVMYAVSTGLYNKGNVIILLNADGKPLLYGEE